MTLTNNEDSGSSSNSKIPHINKKNIEEQEQDINLQIGTSISQKQIEIVPINEELEISPKQSRNTESNEAESSKKNGQESTFFLGCEDLGDDPLLLTEKILLHYIHFIEYAYQILKEDEKKQDWSGIVERVQKLVNSSHLNLTVVIFDMECLEQQGSFAKQYNFREVHIPNILAVILKINEEITSSSSFRVVSDIKNRGQVLPICLGEFERWRQQLRQLFEEMQKLKKMASDVDRDDDTE